MGKKAVTDLKTTNSIGESLGTVFVPINSAASNNIYQFTGGVPRGETFILI